MTQERLVRLAMDQAGIAAARRDPSFGAVLATPEGDVLFGAANAQVSSNDPTAHAEIALIRDAARELGRTTLDGLTVATNAEPCSMCMSALVKSGVDVVVYGAPHEQHVDPAISAAELIERARHPTRLVSGVLAAECAAQVAAARRGTVPPD